MQFVLLIAMLLMACVVKLILPVAAEITPLLTKFPVADMRFTLFMADMTARGAVTPLTARSPVPRREPVTPVGNAFVIDPPAERVRLPPEVIAPAFVMAPKAEIVRFKFGLAP